MAISIRSITYANGSSRIFDTGDAHQFFRVVHPRTSRRPPALAVPEGHNWLYFGFRRVPASHGDSDDSRRYYFVRCGAIRCRQSGGTATLSVAGRHRRSVLEPRPSATAACSAAPRIPRPSVPPHAITSPRLSDGEVLQVGLQSLRRRRELTSAQTLRITPTRKAGMRVSVPCSTYLHSIQLIVETT